MSSGQNLSLDSRPPRHASGDSCGWGWVQAEQGAGPTDITWPRLVYPPGRGQPDPRPPTAQGHRRAWLTEAAHVQGGQQRAELGQRRCGREREALGDPAHLSTATKSKENREAGMGWGHTSISPRGRAAEGGQGPCLTGPSPPGRGPASAWGRQAMGIPSPSWAQLCTSGGAGLRGGGGRHMGSGCSTRGLGDSRGPDPDLPDAAASLRLLCSGEGLNRD